MLSLLIILISICENKKESSMQTQESIPLFVSTRMMKITGETSCDHRDEKTVSLHCVYFLNDQLEQIKISHQFRKEISFANQMNHISYIHLLLIRIVFSIVAILIFIVKVKQRFLQEKTFIIVILGDCSTRKYDSYSQRDATKYGNYCPSSYALLIKRLSIKYLGLNEQHILICGKGEIGDNNIGTIVPKNRIFIQLTANEIYETKALDFEFDFIPFQNVDDLLFSIYTFLNSSNCSKPNIILYMYDHGDKYCFGNLKLLEFYLRLMKYPHSSLYVYNESYKSNSMLLQIKNYFAISEIISSFKPKITQNELLFLVSVANKIYPNGGFLQWNTISSLDNRYFKYISKNDGYNYFNDILSFYRGEIQLNRLYNKYRFDFSKEDIDSLILIVECYMSQYSFPFNYHVIHSIFEKGIKVIKALINNFNITNSQLNQVINEIKDNKPDFVYEQYKIHPNHFIMTCSYEKGYSPTFGTIKINEKEKLIAGSPAMGSIIIETLMNRTLSKNSINNIKKMVYGNHESFILEYALKSPEIKKKKWAGLNINYWETKSSLRKKILLNQDIKIKNSLEDIMKLVGFKLVMKCDIQFNDQNKCITGKTQPIIRSSKKLNINGHKFTNLNHNYDYKQGSSDDDSYYDDSSEGSNNAHNQSLNTSKSTNDDPPNLSSSCEDLVKDNDYDKIIPQSYINKVIHEVIKSDWNIFPLTVIKVFEYEVNKLTKDEKFITKYSSASQNITKKTTLDEIDILLHNWIRHFFPVHEIEQNLDSFILFFYEFVIRYGIPEKDSYTIFHNCMNIADQVASQLSHSIKAPAYYVDRLKNDS